MPSEAEPSGAFRLDEPDRSSLAFIAPSITTNSRDGFRFVVTDIHALKKAERSSELRETDVLPRGRMRSLSSDQRVSPAV